MWLDLCPLPPLAGRRLRIIGEERPAKLKKVELEDRSLAAYAPIVGEEVIQGIRQAAEPLRDARLVHINATTFGGGVAEMAD